MRHTGLRIAELCGIDVFDIFDGHEVRTELYVRAAIAKGGAQVRVIPLNAAARRGITDQLVFRRTRGV